MATNDVSPEFGRFAGGIVNMSTVRRHEHSSTAALISSCPTPRSTPTTSSTTAWGQARPAFRAEPIGRDGRRTRCKGQDVFLRQLRRLLVLRQGTTNLTTTPTAAMRAGDFSAAKIPSHCSTRSAPRWWNGVYNAHSVHRQPDSFETGSTRRPSIWQTCCGPCPTRRAW